MAGEEGTRVELTTSTVLLEALSLGSIQEQLAILLFYNSLAECPVFHAHSPFTDNLLAPPDEQSFYQILTHKMSSIIRNVL